MKFSDAMKALEDGEVVKRPGKRSYYAAPDGRFRRWILFESGNAVEITATFVRQDVEADDWAIARTRRWRSPTRKQTKGA